MKTTTKSDCRAALRRARLPDDDTLTRLLMTLRNREETHITAATLAREGDATPKPELEHHLQRLARHRLIGRVPCAATEPVYDTIPHPHSHLIYECTPRQIVDLHVSRETLLTLLQDLLTTHGAAVDVTIRIHAEANDGLPLPAGISMLPD